MLSCVDGPTTPAITCFWQLEDCIGSHGLFSNLLRLERVEADIGYPNGIAYRLSRRVLRLLSSALCPPFFLLDSVSYECSSYHYVKLYPIRYHWLRSVERSAPHIEM